MPTTILDLIDLRSFSNVWYWLFLGVTWSRILNQPLGIPIDLIRAARGEDDAARDRLAVLTEIMVQRYLDHRQGLGVVLVAGWAFVLSALVILSVGYGLEIAQALLILVFPLAVVAGLMGWAACYLAGANVTVDALPGLLLRLRLGLQLLALVTIFFSAVWGMYHNLSNLIP